MRKIGGLTCNYMRGFKTPLLLIPDKVPQPANSSDEPLSLPSLKPQIGHGALIAVARVCISNLRLCLSQLRLRQIRNAAQAHLIARLGEFQCCVGLIE